MTATDRPPSTATPDLSKYPTLMSIKDVSDATETPVKTVRKLIDTGALPSRRAGRFIKVPRSVIASVFFPEHAGTDLSSSEAS